MSFKQQFLDFSFSISRDNDTLMVLSKSLDKMIQPLHLYYLKNSLYHPHLELLFQYILFLRDIRKGKGERTMTFMMIYTLYSYFPELSFYAIQLIVYIFGSWRDIREICSFVKEFSGNSSHPIIFYSIELANQQLYSDFYSNTDSNNNNTSLVAKWIPREKSSHSWLWHLFVKDWMRNFYPSNKPITECYKRYRWVLSTLNRSLQTSESLLCSRLPALHHNFHSLIRMPKYFPFIKEISMQYRDVFNNGFPTLSKFVKLAIHNNHSHDALINSQWKKYISSFQNNFSQFIPIIDSIALNEKEIYSAIGLASLICEKTTFGRRILIIGKSSPIWVNLDSLDFASMVRVLYNVCTKPKESFDKVVFNNSRIVHSFFFFLQPFLLSLFPISHFHNFHFFIFSDFSHYRNNIHSEIISIFSHCNIHLESGNIVYWNLSKTVSDFIDMSSDKNRIFISGCCPYFLNHIQQVRQTDSFFILSSFLQKHYSDIIHSLPVCATSLPITSL